MKARDSIPELLEPLRNGPVGVSTPEQIEAERRALLPWLEGRIATLPLEHHRHVAARRRRRAQVIAGVTVLAAAAGALFVWGWRTMATQPEMARGVDDPEVPYATLVSGRLSTGAVDILPGSRLGAASLVQSSEEEPAVLRGSGGYVAELSPGGQLALGAPGAEPGRQELRLERGEVRLSVPKLARGSTLSVLTGDARVTVRGTRFSVALWEDAAPEDARRGDALPGDALPGDGRRGDGPVEGATRQRTCVRVAEGAVEVHRRGVASVLLGPGEHSGCREAPTLSANGQSTRPPESSAPSSQKAPPRGPTSTLKQESELLASALSAEQQGDRARARRELRTLLRRYPQSPLANEARAALGRLAR